MIGAIAGDIIGSVYERNPLRPNQNFHLFKNACRFTDDSVLTIAVADSLMHSVPYEDKFRAYYAYFPNRGYGKGFRAWCEAPKIEVADSYGNGSAMRVSPVGWFCDTLQDTICEAERQCAITHNHVESYRGAGCIAGAIFLARTGRPKNDIRCLAEQTYKYDLDIDPLVLRKNYHFASCQATVPVAVRAFLETSSAESAIRQAIRYGGDADTVASMAGAIAEAYYQNIPDRIAIPVWKYLYHPNHSWLGDKVAHFRKQVMPQKMIEQDERCKPNIIQLSLFDSV